MNETAINKLKTKAKDLAGSALARVELATEESRLKTRFQSLAVQGDLLGVIKDDPAVVELLGEIEEGKRRIDELEKKIAGERP